MRGDGRQADDGVGTGLRDLIDAPRARPVLDALAESTGYAFALLDPEGGVVLAAGWRSACVDFHRTHPDAAAACDRHDRALPGLPCGEGRAVTLACPHGLVVSAAPIVVDGRDVGRAVAGQVFLQPTRRCRGGGRRPSLRVRRAVVSERRSGRSPS